MRQHLVCFSTPCCVHANDVVYAVQAIIISNRAAHGLGYPKLNANLLGAAVRIAQDLGLHKITSKPVESVTEPADIFEMIELEIGKRAWLQLVIQDHFSIPFTDAYSMSDEILHAQSVNEL